MDIAARPARDEELELLGRFATDAVAELRSRRGGVVWAAREGRPEPVGESLAATAADPDAIVLTGSIDGVPVGYAAARLVRLHDGDLLGDLTDLYVLPGARGVGVGEALMEGITEWCRARSCVGIDSIALPGDRETKNFFETFGLVARALRVHRSL